MFLRSVQFKSGAPYAVVNLHLARDIYERDPDAFVTHTALPVLATLATDIEHAHQTLIIGSADPATANLLQVSLGTPTAECHCVVTNREGVAIYAAEIIYRNDCVKLYINLLDGSRSRAKPAGPKTRAGTVSSRDSRRMISRRGKMS
jgi:GntR family transcriptional regulator